MRDLALTEITLHGYRSFRKKHTLSFEAGPVFVLGKNHDDPKFESNGAGKTTVLSAILWALYGVLPTTGKTKAKDRVINRKSDRVFVELKFNRRELIVRRSKERGKPEALTLWWEDRWWEGDLDDFMQPKLTEILGLSSVLFMNSVWIDGQSKAVQFVWATPGERLQILEEMLADGLYTKARSVAEARRKEWQTKRDAAKAKVEDLTAQELREKQRLDRSNMELSKATLAAAQRRKEVQGRQVDLRVELARLSGELNALEAGDTPDSLLAEQQELEMKRRRLATEAANVVVPRRLPEGGAECPTCFQDVPHEHVARLRTEAETATTRQQALRREIMALDEKIDAVKDKIREYKANDRVRDALAQQIKSASAELSKLQSAPKGDPYVESLHQTIAQTKETIRSLHRSVQMHTKDMHEADKNIPLFKFWEAGFGARGIRSLLLDDVRAILAHHVDEYVAALAGEQIRVEFPASDKGFEILLHTPDGVADLSTFSRGEVWRANLAVLLALRRCVQFLNSSRLGLLFLDDPCGDLDDAGVRAVIEAVGRLGGEFSNVFVTLPRQVDNIDESAILYIIKRNSESTIEVEEEVEL